MIGRSVAACVACDATKEYFGDKSACIAWPAVQDLIEEEAFQKSEETIMLVVAFGRRDDALRIFGPYGQQHCRGLYQTPIAA